MLVFSLFPTFLYNNKTREQSTYKTRPFVQINTAFWSSVKLTFSPWNINGGSRWISWKWGTNAHFQGRPCWVQGVYYKCSFQGGSFFRFGSYGSTYWIATKSGEKKMESCQLGTPSKFQKSLGVGETSENESHGWAGFCLWVRWHTRTHTHIKKVEFCSNLSPTWTWWRLPRSDCVSLYHPFFSVNNAGTNYQPQLLQEFWTIGTRWAPTSDKWGYNPPISKVITPVISFYGHFYWFCSPHLFLDLWPTL